MEDREDRKIKIGFMGTPDFACPTLEKLYYDNDIELCFVVTKEDKPAGRGKEMKESDVKQCIKKLCDKENAGRIQCVPYNTNVNECISDNERCRGRIVCDPQNDKTKDDEDINVDEQCRGRIVCDPLLGSAPYIFTPHKIKEDREVIEAMKKCDVDFIVVVAYGQILSKEILDIPKYACINGHASILPKYRGSSPIQASILSGDKETGTTAMLMGEGLDEGDILNVKKIDIQDDDTGESLFEKLSHLTADVVLETIKNYRNIVPIKQDSEKATYVKMIKKEDGLIDFENETFEEIDRKVRAYYPWPGAYIIEKGKRIKIFKIRKAEARDAYNASPTEQNESNVSVAKYVKDNVSVAKYAVGSVEDALNASRMQDKLVYKVKNGYIEVLELQQEGKKRMNAREYLNGIRN